MTLDDVLAEACRLLAEGVAEARSPFRTPTLATVDALGAPELRSVVLRGFDATRHRLSVHTDLRSAKVAQLRRVPAVALHVWDAARRWQLRVTGTATLHAGDDVATAAWAALSELSRQLYRVRQTPGTELADPSAANFDETAGDAGFRHFAVIDIACTVIETLQLTGHGQIRARFAWTGGVLSAAWLVP